jgi:hypothetical protein
MTGISKSSPTLLCLVFGYEGLEDDFATTRTYSALDRSCIDKISVPAFEGIETDDIPATKNSFLFKKLIADLNKLSGIFYLHNGKDGQCVEFPHGHVHGIVTIAGRADNCRPLGRIKSTVKDMYGYIKTDTCLHPQYAPAIS